MVEAAPIVLGDAKVPTKDIAVLRIVRPVPLSDVAVEFAAPFRYGRKRFSVLGFPDGLLEGRNATGILHAENADGLVQMDGTSALLVEGGFSGAPVWSSGVGGFVGMVVTELSDRKVAWCIPSRTLCAAYNDLLVRFHIPSEDRPKIHDYWEDDPNIQLFGTTSNDGRRKLTARVCEYKEYYTVNVTYECIQGAPEPRGGYVTFITYPDFERDELDAYELFSRVENGKAEQEFYPTDLFTVAAIGDGGETALTLDLSRVRKKQSKRRK